jgi:hypothetical protein
MRAHDLLSVMLVLLVVAGCGRQPQSDTPVRAAAGPTFSDQVEAVRQGTSDSIMVADRPLAAREWDRLRGLTGLRELILQGGVADDSVADVLGSLTGLERLVLRKSPLGDAGFRGLTGCRSLRDLNVPTAACTVAGVRAMSALPGLRSLRLGGPGLRGPEVAKALATFPALRSLHLIDVPIGDDGLAALAGLAGLRNLYLDGAGVSDRAWEAYFDTRPDVHVHVDQFHHDRDPHGDHPP